MSEIYGLAPGPAVDHVDSYADMLLRRQISNFAVNPVDFYTIGLQMAQRCTTFTDNDLILDVGCSSGRFIIEAAKSTNIPAYLIGLDPDSEPFNTFLPPSTDTSRFTFMHGVGEDIPLPDNSVKLVTAHNVLFRAQNLEKMLEEMKRVTEPDGLIAISTNTSRHAKWRHRFESWVAAAVAKEVLGITLDPLHPPAHGAYLEQIPGVLENVGGLRVIDSITQTSLAKITRGERLETFAYSLQLSANRIPHNDPRIRHVWRRIVRSEVVPFIERQIDYHEETLRESGETTEPYFADTVERGLFVLRNVKS